MVGETDQNLWWRKQQPISWPEAEKDHHKEDTEEEEKERAHEKLKDDDDW
jgi:hypothetical protein